MEVIGILTAIISGPRERLETLYGWSMDSGGIYYLVVHGLRVSSLMRGTWLLFALPLIRLDYEDDSMMDQITCK